MQSKQFACLDIGAAKLVCLVADISEEQPRIIGYSHKESKGFRAGTISDINIAERSIINAIADVEKTTGYSVDELTVIISASQTNSTQQEFSIKINGENIRISDIEELTKQVRNHFQKKGKEIIHLIPIHYRIDNSLPIDNPKNMSGNLLFAKFHIIYISQTIAKNLENCFKRCQISINNYLIDIFASSLSNLSANEINFGSLLIDIGASSSSFGIFKDGKFIHSGHINIAGNNITKDIATILNIDFSSAEKIKNLNNSLIISNMEEREMIRTGNTLEDSGNYEINKLELKEIIKSRIEEIFAEIKKEAAKNKINLSMVNNVVLTGGVANIVGLDRLANDIFQKNVRIGYPKVKNINLNHNNPSHSAIFGSLFYYRKIAENNHPNSLGKKTLSQKLLQFLFGKY